MCPRSQMDRSCHPCLISSHCTSHIVFVMYPKVLTQFGEGSGAAFGFGANNASDFYQVCTVCTVRYRQVCAMNLAICFYLF